MRQWVTVREHARDAMLTLCACALVAALLPAGVFPCEAAAATDDADDAPVVVSLGDSYSSGEGNEPFYGQESELGLDEYYDKYSNEDWLAHRSELSWPGRLVVDGVQLSSVKYDSSNFVPLGTSYEGSWYFQASSGAVAENVYETAQDKTVKQLLDDSTTDAEVSVQIESANEGLSAQGLTGEDVDYVTMTIGGNDVGFSDIITCVFLQCGTLDRDFLQAMLDKTWRDYEATIEAEIAECYEQVSANYPNARILIVGYPTLLDDSESSGSSAFSTNEAQRINSNVRMFNECLEELVNKHNASGNLYFVSVEELFDGHEAYSDDPYLYSVILGAQDEDLNQTSVVSAYSLHPNSEDDGGVAVTSASEVNSGVTAYAWAVQQKIDELEAADTDVAAGTDGASGETAGTDAAAGCDIAMVLDVSGSMAGDPIESTKEAAAGFTDVALGNGAQLSLTVFDDEASTLAELTASEAVLTTAIESIDADGGTDIEEGLCLAAEGLAADDASKQYIVLMSDGEPNNGLEGDELIAYAESIRDPDGDGVDEVIIYTLGFNLGSSGQYLLEGIASENRYYSVQDASDLEDFFADWADEINGVRYIYAEIACPVDVSVTYEGETLTSAGDEPQTRTTFGTLAFKEAEDGTDVAAEDAEDAVKVLRLREGASYDIEIEGTGEGSMSCTVGFVDDDGLYSDNRTFGDVDVTQDLEASLVAEVSDLTVLEVDEDGDGSVDKRYRAGMNEEAELVDSSWVVNAVLAGAAAVCVLVVAVYVAVNVRRWRRRKAAV